MNILVVNDDGYLSEGLKILVEQASNFGTVYICAPQNQQSAQSSALSIKKIMNVKEIYPPLYGSKVTYALDGTPVDCVKGAMSLFDIEFDLLLSGINKGANIGTDVLYSGTVGAALEGFNYNIPSIAFSAAKLHLEYLPQETYKVLNYIISKKLYSVENCLNVNFPEEIYSKPLGINFTKQGKRVFTTSLNKVDNEDYEISFTLNRFKENPDTDCYAFENGYISITPLTIDRTAHKKLTKLLKK